MYIVYRYICRRYICKSFFSSLDWPWSLVLALSDLSLSPSLPTSHLSCISPSPFIHLWNTKIKFHSPKLLLLFRISLILPNCCFIMFVHFGLHWRFIDNILLGQTIIIIIWSSFSFLKLSHKALDIYGFFFQRMYVLVILHFLSVLNSSL